MSIFKNVLVGIDLLQADSLDSTNFSPPVEEAIKHGLWLAEKASASVTFFAAVDVPEDELFSLAADETRVASQLQRSGQRALDHLVDSARKRGLTADAKLVSGEGWIEIIREVQRGGHDVVIVGTRNVGALQRFLFGSTAMRLLHNCPCPVWVTRPEPRPVPHNILITSDFSPVSDITVKLGLAVGELSGAKVNLLHAVDYPLDRLWRTGLLDSNTQIYRDRVNADARERLNDQLARVAAGQPAAKVELHVVEGLSIADTAILDFIQHHHIDLVLMGTLARSGLPGVFIGNTAERLLTHVPCSMLAVKPADFKSPIGPAVKGSGSDVPRPKKQSPDIPRPTPSVPAPQRVTPVFKNVLVGIDLFQADVLGSTNFSRPVEEAIKHGLWLAERAHASVTFFAAVHAPEPGPSSRQADESHAGPFQLGRQALDQLVDSAKNRGLAADAKLASGEGWVEIIREVERGGHDVVIVGTRNVGAVQRFLFGSTAMRLLHNCPCPVWVTRPEPRPVPHNILVSSDLSPESDITVDLGLAIGELTGAKVNLLNSVDYVVDRLWSTGLRYTNVEQYHQSVRAEAREQLAQQLARVAGGQPAATVELHIVAGDSTADNAILDFIQHHQIDLLVMGTMARGGLPGVAIGNTAERLVTHIPCSMLAIKPPDFKSHISPLPP